MPKVIIDDEANALVVGKAHNGFPVYAGPDGTMLAPGIASVVDVEEGNNDRWQPADPNASALVLAVEACREFVFLADNANDTNRARVSKSMTVPICALMDVLDKLCKGLDDERSRACRGTWKASDQKTYKEARRRLRKASGGRVRSVRNKVAAHLDTVAIGDPSLRLKPREWLQPMGDALIVLLLALRHDHSFTWIRPRGKAPSGGDLVQVMFVYPTCTTFRVDESGRVVDIVEITLAEDPRHLVDTEVVTAMQAYNQLIETYEPDLSPIWISRGGDAPGPPLPRKIG